MSSNFKPELAGYTEDSALRAILRNTFMPGKISLSFQREPDFFTAEQTGNLESQIIAVRESKTGKIAGFGCRSFRKIFIDSQIREVGYLSGLRCLPEYRGGTLLARAYRYLYKLHEDGRVPYYFTTIFEENEYAKKLLTSQRVGLPIYRPFKRIQTLFIPLYGVKGKLCSAVRKGGVDFLPAALESINHFNSLHQFSPYYSLADFSGQTSLLPNFDPMNLYTCIKGSSITATAGVWDQNSFKQSVVAGYSPLYHLLRPLTNLGSKMGVSPKLPRVGNHFPYLYASFISYADGSGKDLISVIRHIQADWSDKGFAYLLLGIHEHNPILLELQNMAAMSIFSGLYLVYWPDLVSAKLPSINLVPHVEISTL